MEGPYPTMSGQDMSYAGNSPLGGQMAQMPTLRQRLDLAVKQAEERLAAVKEARELFDRNPDVEKLLNIMQRAHF